MIPRHHLPQIPANQRERFCEYLLGHDVKTKRAKIAISSLRPIQQAVKADKVEFFKDHPEKLAEPLVISKEGFILDGHHRYIAQKQLDPAAKMNCIVCNCNIKTLIDLGLQFDGAEVKTMTEAWLLH
jgi:hypothetical protein